MEAKKADVAVIGAGLSGLTTAFDLAEMGRRILLVERSSAHGGHLVLLDRQFPTDSCGFCQILPSLGEGAQTCLKTLLNHPRVHLMLNTHLQEVEGEAGRFRIHLRSDPTGVDVRRCTRCGRCVEVCPESYPDPFQGGVLVRKAVDLRSPLCMGSWPYIDWSRCSRCGACVEACPEGAVELDEGGPWEETWQVGALVLAPGFRPVDATSRPEYGYGRLPDVVTSLELERLMAKAQMEGDPLPRRPSDGKVPSRIAWIQCVGSRDQDHAYCSSVCCMISLKEARLCRTLLPQAYLEIFYMDLRCGGKGYESYLRAAREMDIHLSRGRPAEVLLRGDRLVVQVEHADGSWREEPFDLVVLSVGFEVDEDTRSMASLLEIPLDPDGFLQTVPGTLSCTAKEGIYVAGSVSRPQDIPESVIQAHEAAALASLHAPPESDEGPCRTTEEASPFDPALEDLRILVALCDCSGTLADSFQWDLLEESIQGETGVVGVYRAPHICLQEGMEELRCKMEEAGANALVVGSCTPRWLLPRITSRLSQLRVDPHLLEVVNLREQTTWPHTEQIEEKTRQARAHLLAALAKVRAYRGAPPPAGEIYHETSGDLLVVGGGPAGLSAALQASRLGRKVTLVERSSELGGHLREIYTGVDPHLRPQRLLEDLRHRISSQEGVEVLTRTSVVSLTGRAGAFRATLDGPEGDGSERLFGAVILATGGKVHRPSIYGYGQSPQVMTQRELEAALAEQKVDPASLREVVMIQCAGSRDQGLPYCSRICCASALKNARSLLEANPRIRLIVLYRDMRAFGTMERLYTEIRQKGGLFILFDPQNPPKVEEDDKGLLVEARDPLVGIWVRFRPDRVILSTGITPELPEELLASLGIERDSDGFLRERNPKFRPLDLAEGVFACGLALGPAFLEEAMAQGRGAALRACGFLHRMEQSFHPRGAWVHPWRCSACGLCVQSCPFGARRLDPEQGHAVVEAALCQACGTCTAVCPNDATQLREISDGQILSAIDALMEV